METEPISKGMQEAPNYHFWAGVARLDGLHDPFALGRCPRISHGARLNQQIHAHSTMGSKESPEAD